MINLLKILAVIKIFKYSIVRKHVIMLLVSLECHFVYFISMLFKILVTYIMNKEVSFILVFVNLYSLLVLNARLRLLICYIFLIFSYNMLFLVIGISLDILSVNIPLAYAEEIKILVTDSNLGKSYLVGKKPVAGLKGLVLEHSSPRWDHYRSIFNKYDNRIFYKFSVGFPLEKAPRGLNDLAFQEHLFRDGTLSPNKYVIKKRSPMLFITWKPFAEWSYLNNHNSTINSVGSSGKENFDLQLDQNLLLTKSYSQLDTIINQSAFITDFNKLNEVLENIHKIISLEDKTLSMKLRTAFVEVKSLQKEAFLYSKITTIDPESFFETLSKFKSDTWAILEEFKLLKNSCIESLFIYLLDHIDNGIEFNHWKQNSPSGKDLGSNDDYDSSEDEKLKNLERFSYLSTMVGRFSPADQQQIASEIVKDMPFKEDLGSLSHGVYDPNITYLDPYISGDYERSISGPTKAGVNQAPADLSK